MPRLFPIHRPSAGISFSSTSVGITELHRPWFGKPVVTRVAQTPLPSGVLCPSRTAMNLKDSVQVVEHLRQLTEGLRDRAVAVSLPDLSACIGLFSLESFPPNEAERIGLLRWRFEQHDKIALGDAVLQYRVFHAPQEDDRRLTNVLAVMIKQPVLREYETALHAAGLLPVSVGVAALQLFELCRPLMTSLQEVFFAHHHDETLTVMAIRHGIPVFLRTIPLRRRHVDLRRELIGTLQFYNDQVTSLHRRDREAVTTLYVVSGEPWTPAEPSSHPEAAKDGQLWLPTGQLDWRVKIVQIGWGTVPVVHRAADGASTELSSLASGMAA